jgi:hypothetical protein
VFISGLRASSLYASLTNTRHDRRLLIEVEQR